VCVQCCAAGPQSAVPAVRSTRGAVRGEGPRGTAAYCVYCTQCRRFRRAYCGTTLCVCVRACVCVCVCVCSAISRRWISTSLDLHIEVTLLLEVEFPACCEAASNSSTGCCFTEPSHIYPRSGEHGSCERALLRCPIGRYIHTCNSKVIFNIGHCLLFTSQHSVCSQGVSRIRRLMGPLL